jgi:hypothetical protein
MVNIIRYRLKEDGRRRFHVISYEVHVCCPICGRILLVIGSRRRGIVNSAGEKQILIIRRLRCESCQTIHHELPDIIIPYKRHCAESVEKIIAGDATTVYCDGSTARRIRAWWAACYLYFESVLASLKEKYGTGFSNPPAPKEIVRAVVNAHLWIHTRSAFLSG